MTKTQTKIDPKHFYSLGEIVREGIIPGIDTVQKASNLVRNDLLFNKILRAQILQTGRSIQYKIRGSNIISFLVQRDNG